jgi:hypothetical protein
MNKRASCLIHEARVFVNGLCKREQDKLYLKTPNYVPASLA